MSRLASSLGIVHVGTECDALSRVEVGAVPIRREVWTRAAQHPRWAAMHIGFEPFPTK